MNLIEFFALNPVFTYEEFKQFLVTIGTRNLNTQRELLSYHLKKQNIMRVRRELFASIPISARESSAFFQADPFLIAGRIANDAVLAYHTAFDFFGVSYSLYHQIIFLSQNHIRPFDFQHNSYLPLPFPKSLIEQNCMDYEVVKVDRQGLSMKVTSLERSIVDALDRPKYAGGWEEIWHTAEHIPILNLDKVIEYAKLLNNATTFAKLGFFLEQFKDHFNTDKQSLNFLEKMKPSSIHYLERSKRESGKLVPRWNLVIPNSILERAWEEPNSEDF